MHNPHTRLDDPSLPVDEIAAAPSTTAADAPLVGGEFALLRQRFCVIPHAGSESQAQAEAQADAQIVGTMRINGCIFLIRQSQPNPQPATSSPENSVLNKFTERERQIAMLVSKGLLNKQIADQLHISEHTVSSHLRHIFSKLRVRTRAAMVFRFASALAE